MKNSAKTRFSRFIFIKKVWFDGENTYVYVCLYSGIDIYRVDINFIFGGFFFQINLDKYYSIWWKIWQSFLIRNFRIINIRRIFGVFLASFSSILSFRKLIAFDDRSSVQFNIVWISLTFRGNFHISEKKMFHRFYMSENFRHSSRPHKLIS